MTIAIPKGLLAKEINAYTDAGYARKKAFHAAGKKFLKELAAALGIQSYDLRSNEAGMAVSGEVTLHSDTLYVQLSESCVGEPGVSALYRDCKGRKDYCGGQNNIVHLASLRGEEQQARFIARCRQLAHLD